MPFSKPFSKSKLIKLPTTYLGASIEQAELNAPIVSSKFEEDPEILELLLDFIKGISIRIESIEKAIENSDFLKLKDEAHRFYGSAALYGYAEIASLSAKLELNAESCSTSICREVLDQIRNTYLCIQAGVVLMERKN